MLSELPAEATSPRSSATALEFSVVLVAPQGMATIGRTMRCLRAQSARRSLEVVIVAPVAAAIDREALGAGEFGDLRVVEAGPITERGAAAALGMLGANAQIVGLIEDHSFPEPAWAAALISTHSGTWTGVGPAVENANPKSALSWVNFILAYAKFAPPVAAGERDFIPWHNSAYKRDALAPFAPRLGALLEWEGALQDELRAAGQRLYLEPAARTHHMNVSSFTSTMGLNLRRGRLMGGQRAERERWSALRRLMYIVAFPLFPFVHFRNLLPSIRRMKIAPSMMLRVAPALALSLFAMAAGEAQAFAMGTGNTLAEFEDYELNRAQHLSRSDRLAMQMHPSGDALTVAGAGAIRK